MIDRELLLTAYRVAIEAVQHTVRPDDAILVETQAVIYEALVRRRARGFDPLDPEAIKEVLDALINGVKEQRA